MMNRLSFLASLIGLPVASFAVESKPQEPKSEPAPQITIPEVQWIGDGVATISPAWSILEDFGHREVIAESQKAEARRFYGGHQWDEHIAHERKKSHRPCLIVNRLPSLVAASLAVTRRPLSDDEIDRLCIIITLRNMDAQRFYNYMASAAVEMAAINSKNARARITRGPA
jgi:hypothetical protein